MPILIFISLFTLLDFVLLFSVGSHIGLLATLLLIFITGFTGLHLIRKEGVDTFARAKRRMQAGEIPSTELMTGAALIFGGALLMAPGFLSDALGLACLIPNARQLLFKGLSWLGLKATVNASSTGGDNWGASKGNNTAKGDSNGPLEGDFISGDDSGRRGS